MGIGPGTQKGARSWMSLGMPRPPEMSRPQLHGLKAIKVFEDGSVEVTADMTVRSVTELAVSEAESPLPIVERPAEQPADDKSDSGRQQS